MTTTQAKRNQPAAPTAPGAAAVGSGGTFAAGAQFWKITAIVAGLGESAPSAEVTQTLALNGSCNLTWTNPPNTTGVRIYRGTVTNTENVLVAQLAGSPVAFTDTNLNAGAATPPAAATFGNVTLDGASRPTKANYAGSRPPGLDIMLYAGEMGWALGKAYGSTTVETRNAKIAAGAGYLLQEV